MKKLLLFTMVALSIGLMNLRGDDDARLKIPLRLSTGTKISRNVTCVFDLTFIKSMNLLQSYCLVDVGNIELMVTNTSTGEFWEASYDSSVESQFFLQISGTPGYYEIEYTTESGDVYEGSFIIE